MRWLLIRFWIAVAACIVVGTAMRILDVTPSPLIVILIGGAIGAAVLVIAARVTR